MIPVLTHRQALAEARRTYDAIYAFLSADADAETRARLDRVYARGRDALARLVPTDSRLPKDASGAFAAYMDAASKGDPDTKLSWLKMMPRVMDEVTGDVEPVWVLGPVRAQASAYEAFIVEALHAYDAPVLTFKTKAFSTSFTIKTVAAVEGWSVVFSAANTVPTTGRFGIGWPRWLRRRDDAANKQSTLALAA